jgi:hypothetical protein
MPNVPDTFQLGANFRCASVFKRVKFSITYVLPITLNNPTPPASAVLTLESFRLRISRP